MKRIIKDFKNLTPEVVELINEQYPSGYSDAQLVSFVNAKSEFVKAIEVKTSDVIYLIKVDRQLDKHLSEQEEEPEDFETNNDSDEVDFDAASSEDDFTED